MNLPDHTEHVQAVARLPGKVEPPEFLKAFRVIGLQTCFSDRFGCKPDNKKSFPVEMPERIWWKKTVCY
jgi:hypothetical protein